MKSLRIPSFAQLTYLLLIDVLLMSLAGKLAARYHGNSACAAWSTCAQPGPAQPYQLAHIVLGAGAGLIVLWLLRRAWMDHRDDIILLPLTTSMAVLFGGQAFLGAILVARQFRADLVLLHGATAISTWGALLALAAIASLRPREKGEAPASVPTRSVRDFVMLSKPWIVGLLLVTTFGGMVAGARGLPDLGIVIWTLVGGGLAAAGSSALNQYIDRELDKNMQRTARRPLPAGRLSPAEALAFGLALCLASYYLLAGLVNLMAALLAVAGIIYYVVLYSLILKRATVQNIVVGGGAGAIPPMVGWAAATGEITAAAWILFLIIFMWTPPHFWALAIVRRNDYKHAGVPMLPVVKGEDETRRQILIYTILLVVTTLILPLIGAAGTVYAVSAALLGLFLLTAAWRVWRIPGNKVAWTMYRWSSMYLMFIFVALVVDSLL